MKYPRSDLYVHGMSTSPSVRIQTEVYRYLRTVLEQTDRNVFEDFFLSF